MKWCMVEKLAWPPRTAADTQKHMTHLTATAEETLTLVTCSGANLAPFPARLYVTARPVRAAVAAAPTASPLPASATLQPTAPVSRTADLAVGPCTATTLQPAAPVTLQPAAPVAAPQIGAASAAACRATITVRRGETLAHDRPQARRHHAQHHRAQRHQEPRSHHRRRAPVHPVREWAEE